MADNDPVSPDWERILPYKPVRLTEEQWTEIVHYSGLPDSVRPIIGRAIALYREYQASIDASMTAAKTRVELDRMSKDTAAVRTRLIKAMANPEARYALTVPIPLPNTIPEPRHEAHRRLETVVAELQRISQWFGLARDRVTDTKSGAKRRAAPTGLLVHNLDQILTQFTGRRIKRSKKMRQYVRMVCEIADPNIGPGTIDEAIKDQAKIPW